MTWLITFVIEKSGFTPEQIKKLPYFQVLQMVNVWLIRDGGEYRWSRRTKIDKELLDNIL